jgi:hypothetical protein
MNREKERQEWIKEKQKKNNKNEFRRK